MSGTTSLCLVVDSKKSKDAGINPGGKKKSSVGGSLKAVGGDVYYLTYLLLTFWNPVKLCYVFRFTGMCFFFSTGAG